MTDDPSAQLTSDDLKRMTPEAITTAQRAGLCADLLGVSRPVERPQGRQAGDLTPRSAEWASAPADVASRQLTAVDLEHMNFEQIAKATQEGRCDEIRGIKPRNH